MVKIIIENLFKIILIMTIFSTTFVPISNAGYWDDIFNQGDAFINEGKDGQIVYDEHDNPIGTITDEQAMKESVNQIYNILFTLGIALSVIVGAILGIKFMIGSVEEQAKIKEMLLPYMLGCLVVFGAFGIWEIIITLGGQIF